MNVNSPHAKLHRVLLDMSLNHFWTSSTDVQTGRGKYAKIFVCVCVYGHVRLHLTFHLHTRLKQLSVDVLLSYLQTVNAWVEALGCEESLLGISEHSSRRLDVFHYQHLNLWRLFWACFVAPLLCQLVSKCFPLHIPREPFRQPLSPLCRTRSLLSFAKERNQAQLKVIYDIHLWSPGRLALATVASASATSVHFALAIRTFHFGKWKNVA